MSGSAISFYNGLNLKQKYVYLNGRSFVNPEDVFYIQSPKSKKEIICFTFDENHRLIPLVSYGYFSGCARRMSGRRITSEQKRKKIYNPFINKHQQVLSAVEAPNNGIKDGVIVDADKFYSTLSLMISAQDLTKKRFSSKHTITLDQNQFTRLFQYGHKKILLGNIPIARQTTSPCLIDYITEYDLWIDKELTHQAATTTADFIMNFGFDATIIDQQEQNDEILFKELDEIFGIATEKTTAKNVTSTLITPMFNRKRQSEREKDLSQAQQPNIKIARTRSPSPFPFWGS